MGIGGVVQVQTTNGFDSHFGVNYLAHFLLCMRLEETLIASSAPFFRFCVIAVGSLIHQLLPTVFADPNFESTPYDPALAYASSKTANVWFANHLQRLYAAQGVHGISLHPRCYQQGSAMLPRTRTFRDDAECGNRVGDAKYDENP